MIKTHKLFTFISVLAFLCIIPAKGQNGAPLRIEYISNFPQGEVDNNLNGLQVVSKPLPGEPYFSSNIQIKKIKSESNDSYESLLNIFPEYKLSGRNISNVDTLISHTGKSNAESWSHHPLSTKYGGIAYRYLNKYSQSQMNWDNLFNEYKKNQPESLINNGDIRTLSSIEKYEYLIGNIDFTMTRSQWQEGQSYREEFGHIPYWVGLCHGTAPASLYSQRPTNAINLKSYNGMDDITFYPSDIKNLLSYAWANNANYSAMLGLRCGRVINYENRPSLNCLDPNPGSFHLAVLNLLGLNSQSFIVDTSAGNEVWNHSIKSYRYKYFRPGTRNFTDKLKYALVSIDNYENDPYFKYRSSETTSLVGVWMELTYITDTKPSDRKVDGAKNDTFATVSFLYDLEINREGNIIGGEWHNVHRPDFLWVIGNDILPKSFYDYVIGSNLNSYDGKSSLPPSIVNYAKLAAQKDQLLFSILESMLRLSQNGH